MSESIYYIYIHIEIDTSRFIEKFPMKPRWEFFFKSLEINHKMPFEENHNEASALVMGGNDFHLLKEKS